MLPPGVMRLERSNSAWDRGPRTWPLLWPGIVLVGIPSARKMFGCAAICSVLDHMVLYQSIWIDWF
jgi:hypothetical protein